MFAARIISSQVSRQFQMVRISCVYHACSRDKLVVDNKQCRKGTPAFFCLVFFRVDRFGTNGWDRFWPHGGEA